MFLFAIHQDPKKRRRLIRNVAAVNLFALLLISLACNKLEKPKSEAYYAETTPPRKQEFRWSNGKAPKSLDPALAAAPPDTDLVRSVFEGLTELDSATLEPLPAVAERWESSDDLKTWTFHLRNSARWSNGKPVTAEDFVRSWKRLGEAGDKVVHADLLTNIVGFPMPANAVQAPKTDLLPTPARGALPTDPQTDLDSHSESPTLPGPVSTFGVTATDPLTLRVQLVTADKDFPSLVAHPMFRPIFGEGKELSANAITGNVVTNGAFRVSAVDAGGVILERSESYWNRESVMLERVRIAAFENAEQALAAYKTGDIDAVTNADFEPLALKLLEPFEDFRRRTHAAINFYEVNHEKPPFDDRRVREALAIAIERERLTEGEMEGETQPALSFLPFNRNSETAIVQDKERARDLLEDAGFPGGENFPTIKLVVNRNDTQQRVARAVARMWKQNLNVETEIVAKDNAEIEQARTAGDYDLIRRNAVFPTSDELMSILSILKPPRLPDNESATASPVTGVEAEAAQPSSSREPAGDPDDVASPDVTMSEANAIYELWAIPLYFPTSYSLVKPYVAGFDMNSLDAPTLRTVSIDNDWQPK